MQHKIANLSAHCPAHAPPHRSAVPRAPGRTLSSCGPTPRQPPAPYRTPCRPPCQCSEFPTHMVTLATRLAQVGPQCPHLAVCTAELLEVQVPSRPLRWSTWTAHK